MDAQPDDVYAVSVLIKEKLKLHPVRIPVRGISMSPVIVPGQKVVIVAKQPEDICVGDILLFYINNRLILHRIIYREKIAGEMKFLTRGDPCDALDDWVVDEDNIIGVIDGGLTFSNSTSKESV